MGNLRPVLIMGLLFLAYLMWIEWQKDYGPAPRTETGTPDVTQSSPAPMPDVPVIERSQPAAADLPSTPVATPDPASGAVPAEPTRQDVDLVRVTTDVLELAINPVGGTVVSAVLLDYPMELKTPERKVELLYANAGRIFVAQSGLLSEQAAPNHTTPYSVEATTFTLEPGQESLRVPLRWTGENGVEVIKTYVLSAGSYEVTVEHEVRNNGNAPWTGSRYEQLQQSAPGDEDDKGGFTNPGRYSFHGIGFYNPEDKFDKIDFDDVAGAISDKMLRRHPHVFGSEEERAAGAQAGSWERIKAAERAAAGWSYRPAMKDGVPVKVWIVEHLSFQR